MIFVVFNAIFIILRILPSALSAKLRFGFHQSNFLTWPGRSTPPLKSELEFLFSSQLEYHYDIPSASFECTVATKDADCMHLIDFI